MLVRNGHLIAISQELLFGPGCVLPGENLGSSDNLAHEVVVVADDW